MIDPQLMQRLSTMDSKRLALLALDLHERLQRQDDASHEPIAIIGMACRLPHAPDVSAYWQLLSEGRSAVSDMPADRWDTDSYYSPDPEAPGKMTTRRGHFIEQPKLFDAAFFGISAREARAMDPQQRLLLETSWQALEDALLPPPTLVGRQVGVFMGISTTDYLQHGVLHVPMTDCDAYMGTGCAASVAAGRVSYVLGLHGPSVPVDTACSSSLVAVHLACQSLRSGESEVALAGGVNLMLLPQTFVYFSRLHALSPDGRCKTFDASADGYGRGEGCGVVVLKRLSDALADGNDIVAVVRGSAVNHDGRSNGLTVPSGLAQEAVVRAALKSARIEARQVAYVEAHGTGTALGDPIELHALGNVHRGRAQPLLVGSAKTNIGHLEAAAGVAGLIKLALMLRHRRIAPHLHLQQRNPYIDWDHIPIEPVGRGGPLEGIDGEFLAGVSSFGFSGTNAHVILQSFDRPQPVAAAARPSQLLCLSARTPDALKQHAEQLAQQLARPTNAHQWADLCWTANTGRTHFEHRLALQAASAADAAALLHDWASSGSAGAQIGVARVGAQAEPAVAFLCSGQGAQSAGMGRALFDTEPVFRATIEECERLLTGHLDLPLREVLWGAASNRLDQTQYTQPALFAVEVALGRMWLAWGVVPRVLLGHSVGEFAAAQLAGVFSLADGLKMIAARGRLMQQRCEPGAMLALACDEAAARRLIGELAHAVSVAAVNGREATVIAGPTALIELLQTRASALQPKRLKVSHAFHSPMMEPMLAGFATVVAEVSLKAPRWPLMSNLSGRQVDAAEITQPAYWVRHVREAVRFGDTVAAAAALGVTSYIEIGPRPVLLGMARTTVTGAEVRWLPSLQPPLADWQRVVDTLRQLYLAGVAVDWAAVDSAQGRRKAVMPTYPFQRQPFWIEGRAHDPAAESPLQSEPAAPLAAVPDGLAGWFYAIDWVDRPAAGPAVARSGPWLVLADSGGLADSVVAALRDAGREVVVVTAGNAWSAAGPGQVVMRPESREDFTRLFDSLGSVPAAVLQLWGLDAATSGDLVAAQRVGFESALALLQATAARGLRTPPRLALVTRNAQAVLQGDSVAGFAHAPVWSLARVAAMEFPALRCQVLDLDDGPLAAAGTWLAEAVDVDDGEVFVARRGSAAHVARLVRRSDVAAGTPATPHGPWLITGGLGGIGLAVAQWLVDAGVRQLALVGRSVPSASAIARLADWRAQGVQVEVFHGNVADVAGCTALVDAARQALGSIGGVMHCAGVMDHAAMLEMDWPRCRAVLAPKLAGAWNLHLATQADQLQQFVCFSSVSSVLGSPGHAGYATANAALDAFAAYRRALGQPALAINWGPWVGTGMAAALTGDTQRRWDALGIYGSLEPADALRAMGLAMATSSSQLAVISTDWERFFQSFPLGLEPPFLAAMTAEARRQRDPSPAWLAVQQRALAAGTPELRHGVIVDWLERELAAVLGAPKDSAFDRTQGFFELGMDSLMSLEFRTRLQVAVGRAMALPMTLTFDNPNLDALARFVERHLGVAATAPPAAVATPASSDEAIAIVGIGCRFPGGADDARTFWRNLAEGHDAISEVPASRWNIDDYHDADPDAPGKMVTRFGGFVDGLEDFDAAFFGVSPREASRLDPQQRMLLETAWRALEDAALAPVRLRDSATGVFVGVSVNDYAQLMARHGGVEQIDAYMGVGNAISMVAGRLAHFLGLQGPVLSVDTACSSSLVALHLACDSLRKGDCSTALAGGVNTILVPEVNVGLSKARMLAPDGRCKTFDAAADGYVRSEGCGMVVLKRLADAQRDGDRIVAVVRASAMNHDGRSSGLTVPNAEAQVALLQACLDKAGLPASALDYVETHGTGTPLGDPIEVQSLARVHGVGRPKERPLLIGAAKSNVGHLESASGAVGLIKTALALANGQIPATLHQHKPNPYIPWHDLPLQVVSQLRPWPATGAPRRAGVSAFGFSGTNAHVILEQAPAPVAAAAASPPERALQLLVLSAKTRPALETLVAATRQQLQTTSAAALPDLCHVLAHGRAAMPYRLALVGGTAQELSDGLPAALQAAGDARVQRQRVAFLFTGQGSQAPNMGRGLYGSEPVFRAAIDACEAGLAEHLDVPLTTLLWGARSGQLGQTQYTQPALFAIEYALGCTWLAWGLTPQVALGHSVGEYAAACLAGVFSLDDALRLIAARGRLMHSLCPPGAMAALECAADRAEELLSPWQGKLALAAINGPRNTVVAGEPEALGALLEELRAEGVRAHRLEVSRAFHSPLMDPMLTAFDAIARQVTYQPPRWALVSNLSGRLAESQEMACADYWVRHAREPVLFQAGISAAAALGANTFVEIGPHPVLTAMGQQVVEAPHTHWVASLRHGHDDSRQLLGTLGTLFVGGAEIDWKGFAAPWQRRPLDAPVYPFERQRYWPDTSAVLAAAVPAPAAVLAAPAPGGHPLLGRAISTPAFKGLLHEAPFSAQMPPFLDDHRIYSMIVVPGASHMAMVASALAEAEPDMPISITQVAFEEVLVVPDDEARTVQLVLTPGDDGRQGFEIYSRAGAADNWLLHAAGRAASQRAGAALQQVPDVDALRARLTDEITTSSVFYQLLSRQGIQLGRQFRWVERLWRGDGEVLGQLRLPADFDRAGDYYVHPGLLDSCFQMMGAALHSKDLEAGALIPIAIEELRFLRRPAGALFEHVRMRPQDGSRPDMRVADLLVFDTDGQPVIEVTGLRIHRAPRSALTRFSQRRLRDAVYGLRWIERPLTVTAGASQRGQRWLLLVDGSTFSAALASLLRAGGAQVRTVVPGPSGLLTAAGEHTLDLADEHAFDRLWRGLHDADGAPTGIVFGWSLGSTDGTAAAIDQAQQLGAMALLRLVQALGRARDSAAPRLVVLTRAAQAADESTPVDLSHAPTIGLARVIANEMPDLGCQRIDLGPDLDDTTQLEQLVAELQDRSSEDQIALRGGARLVQRLGRSLGGGGRGGDVAFAANEPYQLVRSEHGVLEDITLRPSERQQLSAGEVEILVEATGLNFRDVLNALGLYPGDAGPMGGECAGTVVGIGSGVTGLAIGDRVIAIGAGTFNRYTLTDARMVRAMPAGLTPAQAATLPVAYVTAWLGLVEMANLQAGETVLVHAGAGGVGMAAIQLAHHLGAVVHATAGSDHKRALLREMGVAHVYDSRTLDFADGVRLATAGRGVDVVLNSLAGEFIARSVEVTAQGGRFVEIGKNQIWTPQEMAALRPDLGYWRMALDEIITNRPQHIGQMLEQVTSRIAAGQLTALPCDTFPISRVVDALRHLAQARHVGKVVALHGDEAAAQTERPLLQPGGEVLVTGGLGGLGLGLARWLATQGVHALRLVGRSAPTAAAAAAIEQLRAGGMDVTVGRCNVADREAVAELLADMRQRHGRVAAVFHAAGALDDAPLMMLDEARWRTAMDAKLLGALHLDALTGDDELDAFVLFSSAAGVLGTPGQSNYAAANASLDALAHQRRRAGRTALSVDWGPWADAGMAARSGAQVQRMWAGMGIAAIAERAGFATLEMLMRQAQPQALVVHADWTRVARWSPSGSTPPLLLELAGDDRANAAATAEWLAFVERLKAVTPGERKGLMVEHFRVQVARVLGLQSGAEIDSRTTLVDLGLDSLMAVELANQLRAATGAKLRVTQLFDHPTIDALSEYYLKEVLGLHEPVAAPAPAAPAAMRTSELVASIADITDDEVERRLRQLRGDT